MGGRVGTKERKSTECLLCVGPFLKSPCLSHQNMDSWLQLPATLQPQWQIQTKVSGSLGDRIVWSDHSHSLAVGCHTVPNAVGVGVSWSPLPCPCRPPWPRTAFLFNELSPRGHRTWGQAKIQLPGPGPMTRNLRTCPRLLLPGPQSHPRHKNWDQGLMPRQWAMGVRQEPAGVRAAGCAPWAKVGRVDSRGRWL